MAAAADIASLFAAIEGKESVPDVPVEHLDYDYVSKCSDSKEIVAILKVLRSGKEGRYYELENFVEKRLLDVLPPDQRRQYLALKSEPSRADVTSASQEIDAWLQTFGSGGSANKAATSSAAVDDTWTPKEREFAANREKIKGNEAFRAGETEKAIVHYTKSLELKPRDAVVLANRSQARLKAKQFELAEQDASAAIAADPKYVKAWVRRATALQKRGRYGLAVRDFEAALALEPANPHIQKLLEESAKKFKEVEGDDAVLPGPGAYEAYVRDVATAKLSSKRVAIAESDSDEEDEVEAPPPQKPASKRVAIAESDSDGEGSDAKPSSNPSVHVRQPPAPSTKRVPITESDSDEEPARQVAESSSSKRVAIVESDSDEENVPAPAPVAPAPAPAKVQPPPVPIVSPKPKSQGPRVTGPQSHRVEILSDSDSDEEPLPPVASKPAPVLPPVPSVPPTPPSPTLNVAKAVELKASGNAKFSANDYAGAIADYSSALLICPSQPGILSNRAMALMKQEKHGAALADCVEGLSVLDALESGKERVDAALMPPPGIRVKLLYRQGMCERALGNLERAQTLLQQAVGLEPDNARVKQDLAEITQLIAARDALKSTPAPSSSGKPVVVEAPVSPPPAVSPATANTASPIKRVDRTAEAAARAARIAASVPTTLPPPPKSAFDFEKDCRSLLKSPQTLLAYLKELKFTAFTKLFRSQVDPEFVTAVLASLACVGDTVPAGSDDSKAYADTIHKFVGALTKTPSFDMTTMMFTSAEKKVISKIVDYVRAAVGDAQATDVRKWLA